jgi:hypothetical protein
MKKKPIRYSSLNNFVRFPREKKVLLINVFICLCYSRVVLKTTSFKKIATRLGEPMSESSIDSNKEATKIARKIGNTIHKVSNYTPFRSLCFEQAFTLMFMLKKREIASTIYLGVLKSEGESKLKAHAWTRVGNVYPTGNKGKDSYTIISTFSTTKTA